MTKIVYRKRTEYADKYANYRAMAEERRLAAAKRPADKGASLEATKERIRLNRLSPRLDRNREGSEADLEFKREELAKKLAKAQSRSRLTELQRKYRAAEEEINIDFADECEYIPWGRRSADYPGSNKSLSALLDQIPERFHTVYGYTTKFESDLFANDFDYSDDRLESYADFEARLREEAKGFTLPEPVREPEPEIVEEAAPDWFVDDDMWERARRQAAEDINDEPEVMEDEPELVEPELVERDYEEIRRLKRENTTDISDMVYDNCYNQCVVTGSTFKARLEACHIRAVSDDGSDDVSNVIMLRRDIHWLFDHGHAWIDAKSMTFHFTREALADKDLRKLEGVKIKTKRKLDKACIGFHFDKHFGVLENA